MFWIITTLIFVCTTFVTLMNNTKKDDKIAGLKYALSYNEKVDNNMIIDNEHKVIVIQYKKGLMKTQAIESLKEGLERMFEKEYKVLVIDKSFEVTMK